MDQFGSQNTIIRTVTKEEEEHLEELKRVAENIDISFKQGHLERLYNAGRKYLALSSVLDNAPRTSDYKKKLAKVARIGSSFVDTLGRHVTLDDNNPEGLSPEECNILIAHLGSLGWNEDHFKQTVLGLIELITILEGLAQNLNGQPGRPSRPARDTFLKSLIEIYEDATGEDAVLGRRKVSRKTPPDPARTNSTAFISPFISFAQTCFEVLDINDSREQIGNAAAKIKADIKGG